MTRNMMMFERLAYATLALGTVDTIIDTVSIVEKVVTLLVIGVLGVLIYTASRRGSRYGGFLFASWVVVLALFTWTGFGGPAWLQSLAPDEPMSTSDKVVAVVSVVLGAVAVVFYIADLMNPDQEAPASTSTQVPP